MVVITEIIFKISSKRPILFMISLRYCQTLNQSLRNLRQKIAIDVSCKVWKLRLLITSNL
jgi:hypothetical protein